MVDGVDFSQLRGLRQLAFVIWFGSFSKPRRRLWPRPKAQPREDLLSVTGTYMGMSSGLRRALLTIARKGTANI